MDGFLVFAGPNYYPDPNRDFVEMVDTLEQAKELCKNLLAEDEYGVAQNDYTEIIEVYKGRKLSTGYYRLDTGYHTQ